MSDENETPSFINVSTTCAYEWLSDKKNLERFCRAIENLGNYTIGGARGALEVEFEISVLLNDFSGAVQEIIEAEEHTFDDLEEMCEVIEKWTPA